MNFDLEKAKAGEPIEYQEAYGRIEIQFIGVWDAEHVVCKAPWNDKPEIVPVSKLRMVQKREVVRYRVALMKMYFVSEYRHYTYTVDDEDEELRESQDQDFVMWITDWQEYEIGANDVPRREGD